MSNAAGRLFRRFFDAVLPPQCAGCRRPGALLCADCRSRIAWIEPPLCPSCGRMQPHTALCPACRRQPSDLTSSRAAAVYAEPLKSIIHAFKYENRFALAGPLAQLMAEAWPRWQPSLTPPDCVVPVPLHPQRHRERGYNQSQLLATELASLLEMTVLDDGLRRSRPTRPQMELPAAARAANVQGAFEGEPQQLAGRSILLVDDVYTTGATLSAAAAAVQAAGAGRVAAYCLARVT